MRAMAAARQFRAGSAVVSPAAFGVHAERFLERPTPPRRRRITS
jgi:hypothetical protein